MIKHIVGNKSRVFIVPVIICIILFTCSLFQNTYLVDDQEQSIGSFGLIALLLGWMNIYGPGISWLANPALFVSLVMLRNGKIKLSLVYAVIAVSLALSFLLFDELIVNEAGSMGKITAYDTGYWLWLSSMFINLIGIIIYLRKNPVSCDFNYLKN